MTTTVSDKSAPPILSVVVFSYHDVSTHIRSMIESLHHQASASVLIYFVNLNDTADLYTLSLQDDILAFSDVILLSASISTPLGQVRNELLQRIRTPYVAFATVTEPWGEYHAQRLTMLLEENPNDMVCCCGYDITSSSRINTHFVPSADDKADSWLLIPHEIASSAFIYRTALLKQFGGFNNALSTHLDLEIILRLLSSGNSVSKIQDSLFHQYGSAHLASAHRYYTDAKIIFHEFYDLLLRQRHLMFRSNLLLGKLAANCYEWVYAAIHLSVAVIRSPFYSLHLVLKKSIRFISSYIHHILCQSRFSHQCKQLRKRISALHSLDAQSSADIAALPPSKMSFSSNPIDSFLTVTGTPKPFQYAYSKIPSQVTFSSDQLVIPRGMFAGCRTLERVSIPASIQRIEAGAFFGCAMLTQIEFAAGSSLSNIGDYAFAGCTSLTSLSLPNTICNIGSYAFSFCHSLQELLFLSDKGTTSFFPAMLSTLADGIFAGCQKLQQVIFPEMSLLSAVGANAFLGCNRLSNVLFTSIVHSLGDYAFAHCTSLDHFVMPRIDATSSIGTGCFMNCQRLAYFHIPYELRQVSPMCFYGCSSLQTVKSNVNLQIISSKAFSHCPSLAELHLQKRVTYPKDAFDATTTIITLEEVKES